MLFGRKRKAELAAQAENTVEAEEIMVENVKKDRIAVLTSGGDAPGMNAAVRAVVRAGINAGFEVVGFYRGYNGLLNCEENVDYKLMDLRSVSDIIQHGGTMLCTARSPEYNTPEGVEKAAANCEKLGIKGLAVVGGDGSFRGALDLARKGISCVGIPGTIDNDIACSEYTIGFDTACNTAMRMVDNLRDTAESHDRCSVVEVMGRHAGYIAVHTGIACGATSILIPEKDIDLERDVITPIKNSKATGKQHFIIIVAEGVAFDHPELGGVEGIARYVQDQTGIEARATILGHVQRGGSPTARDRVTASELGYRAVELIAGGCKGRVVAVKENKIVDYDIEEALAMKKSLDVDIVKVANVVSK